MSDGRTADADPAASHRRERLRQVVDRYDPDLMRFLRSRLADPSEREDVAQDAYLRLAGYAHVEGLDDPRAFLFRIAENVIRDRRRRSLTRHAADHDPLENGDLAAQEPDPARVAEHRDTLRRVKAAIAALDEPMRTAFVLSRYREMNYVQIADHMQVSVKSVEKYISAALVKLRLSVGRDRPGASFSLEDSR